jgi:hypothetical protein
MSHLYFAFAVFMFLVCLRAAAIRRGVDIAVVVACHYLHVYMLYVFIVPAQMEWHIAYGVAAAVWAAAALLLFFLKIESR